MTRIISYREGTGETGKSPVVEYKLNRTATLTSAGNPDRSTVIGAVKNSILKQHPSARHIQVTIVAVTRPTVGCAVVDFYATFIADR